MAESSEPRIPDERAPAGGRKRALLVAVTLLVAWAGVEALCFLAFFAIGDGGFSASALDAQRAARMADIETGQFTGPEVEVLHPYLGFVYDPGGNSPALEQHHGGVPISEFGLLDAASPIRPGSEDEIVVGIFGGSFAFYFSVYGLPGLIEGLRAVPEFRDKRISVVRVALGGYKQPQQLLALAYLLALGAHFDVVINLDGFNEVALPATGNAKSGIFPFFPRIWSTRVTEVPGHAERALIVRILDLREQRREWAAAFLGPPLAWSPAANLLWWARDRRFGSRMLRAQVELSHVESGPAGYEASGPHRNYAGEGELFEDLAAMWFNASRAMQRLCAGHGIRYWHFLQPNQYVADSKPMGEPERKLAFGPAQVYRHAVEIGYPILRRRGGELAAAGVRFHDLVDVYRDHSEPLYADSCCHVNRRGYALAAQAIASRIAADLAVQSGAARPAKL